MSMNRLNLAVTVALAVGLTVPAFAEKTRTKSNNANERVQGIFSDMCSISRTADSVTINVHLNDLWADGGDEATVALAVQPPAKGGGVVATYDLKTNNKVRAGAGATSQACDNTPATPAHKHAINTKGTGSTNPKGTSVSDRTNPPIIEKEVKGLTCAVSGDSDNPAVGVTVVLPPPSGKATFKEFTLTKKTDTAATWRASSAEGPNIISCLTENGEASAVAVKASWNLKENVK